MPTVFPDREGTSRRGLWRLRRRLCRGRRAGHAGKRMGGGTGEAHRGLTSVSSGSEAVSAERPRCRRWVADRPVVPRKRGNARGGKGPSRTACSTRATRLHQRQTNRVHETRRARRTSKKGGPTHQRRPVRGRGAAAPGVSLAAQAGGARRRWTKLRGLRGESGPEPEGLARAAEERALPGAGDSTGVHPEGERQSCGRWASPRSKIEWCRRPWRGCSARSSSRTFWTARTGSARTAVRTRRCIGSARG